MSKITLKSSFEIILGKDANEYPEEVRMQRWEEWKEAAWKAKKLWVIEHWSDASACAGCVHMNKEKTWCKLSRLPCTVNPILSFQMGMIGMACMGTGYEAEQPQLELFP